MSQTDSANQVSNLKHLVDRYQRLRPTQFKLNNKLVTLLDTDVLNECGRRLGMLRGGVFYFDDEDQSSVLMDYCIYNGTRRGRNAVEQYLVDNPPDDDSDEMTCLRAMQRATYTLLAVLEVVPGVGCRVHDLFTDETRLLIDLGLSMSAVRGLVVATRLLDHGEYVTTGGAALPFAELDDAKMEAFQRKMRQGIPDANFDPAVLIRKALQSSPRIAYKDSTGSVPARSPGERSRALEARRAGKKAANRRCRCGSGKMYKNCCGK